MIRKRCLECNRYTGNDHRRGLCRKCYRIEEIRDGYDPLPRGKWKGLYPPWSAEEKIRLIDLYKDGLSDAQIAAIMNRSLGGITKARQRLKIKVSPTRQALHRRKVAS